LITEVAAHAVFIIIRESRVKLFNATIRRARRRRSVAQRFQDVSDFFIAGA